MNKKIPEQLAEEYVNRQIDAHPRKFPEWSKADVEIAWYDGYQAREEEVAELKAKVSAQPQWTSVGQNSSGQQANVIIKLQNKTNQNYWFAFDYIVRESDWVEKWPHSVVVAWMPMPETSE
jgi:hypothetical protein